MAPVLRSLAVVAALATAARADSPHIAEARQAIDAVRYDDAQRLLLAALHDGGNSPAAVRAIYALAASTAVVLGEADSGEQFYRRWLALEPGATLSGAVAPKLREPFVAAQAYMAAHGTLTLRATRISPTEVYVELAADPLAMAKSACEPGSAAFALFDPAGRARLIVTPATALVAACDESGNRLVEVPVATAPRLPPAQPYVQPYTPPPTVPPRPISKRWTTWAVPAVITGFAASLCLANATDDNDKLTMPVPPPNSAELRSQRNDYIIGGAIVGAAFIGFAIPTVILYLDEQSGAKAAVVPAPAPGGGATLSLVGRF
jgi:hypothetical protein